MGERELAQVPAREPAPLPRREPGGSGWASAVDHERRSIVVCNEGYPSSLAGATLRRLGLTRATDLEGGYHARLALHRGAALHPDRAEEPAP